MISLEVILIIFDYIWFGVSLLPDLSNWESYWFHIGYHLHAHVWWTHCLLSPYQVLLIRIDTWLSYIDSCSSLIIFHYTIRDWSWHNRHVYSVSSSTSKQMQDRTTSCCLYFDLEKHRLTLEIARTSHAWCQTIISL